MNPESVWISKTSSESFPPKSGPLSGLTFAIKDNIDLAGLPTTAACPADAPPQSAPVVPRSIDAGAVSVVMPQMASNSRELSKAGAVPVVVLRRVIGALRFRAVTKGSGSLPVPQEVRP